jgi:hypothetical protein
MDAADLLRRDALVDADVLVALRHRWNPFHQILPR